jgi:hypothetical protein
MTECNPDKYRCEICNYNYSSRQNLWKHNKKYHTVDTTSKTPKMTKNDPTPSNSPPNTSKNHNKNTEDNIMENENKNNYNKKSEELSCEHCNKKFTRIDNLNRHKKSRCKKKKENDESLKKENELLKNQVQQILEILKKDKSHQKIQKINKQLNGNNNIVGNNNNNVNNIVNNNIIIELGKEKLYEVFSKKEQINVLNQGHSCLEYLIKYAHFNEKYPQYQNIMITNLQNDLAYKYNSKTNNFDAIKKSELLSELVSERMFDINEFFDNYKTSIDAKMRNNIEKFIENMEKPSYENEKKKDIKIILYNNKELIL